MSKFATAKKRVVVGVTNVSLPSSLMTMFNSKRPRFVAFPLFPVSFVFASVNAYRSGTDQWMVETLTTSEQCQLSFIDNYTAALGKTWDDSQFQADVAKREAMFKVAGSMSLGGIG